MQVRVLFFGMLKEFIGASAETVEVPERASVRDMLRHYEVRIPQIHSALASLALAVNKQYASPDTPLNPND